MLSIRHLSKTYANGVRALRDVSLDVPKGIFGLLGANGAGKTSLMRTIATLQLPDQGTITFAGVDALANPEALRRQLGYLPQDFGLYPRMTARAMLDHLAELKGLTDRRTRLRIVDELLEQTNLRAVASKRLGGFSGGMRQRFGIAQALLGDPKLLIVDEPTAGLDPEERNRFHALLSEIGRDVVVILSTHIVDDVAKLCSSIAIMEQGEVVAHGTVDHLLDAFRGRIWAKLVEPGEVPAYRSEYHVISSRLTAGRRTIEVLAEEGPGNGFEAAPVDLEHVYLATLADRRAALNAAASRTAA